MAMPVRRSALTWAAVLAIGFATHVGMTVQLAGRTAAAPLVVALTLGALATALIVAGRPVRAVCAMDRTSQLLAAAAGMLLVFGAPALVASVRMTDAPSGSLVVFWMSGGWAVLAAAAGAAIAWQRRSRSLTGLALAGGLAALVGAAGIVANWERPSSFSPLVRFPSQELAIVGAGLLVLAGAMFLIRAARAGGLDGALVCATATGAAGGLAWWAMEGLSLEAFNERPAEMVLAGLAWGVVCVALPRVIRSEGVSRTGALLAPAPLLLTLLIFVEQIVGVAGPQPMIVNGVVAGVLVLLAGAVGLWSSNAAAPSGESAPKRPIWTWLALIPLVLAAVGLAFPAMSATADVPPRLLRWTLLGWESLAGLAAFALAAVAGALSRVRRPLLPAAAALVACGAWTLLGDTPLRVLKDGLAPGIEQYYGTEYGSITFVALTNPWSLAAVVLATSVLVMVIALALVSGRTRRAGAHSER